MENISQYSIKYRPVSLDEVFGQSEIVKSLKARIKEQKFPTAMLFQGPVGTGKSTCAKIIAMAMQCHHPHEDGTPCLECPSCKSILNDTYDRDTIMLDGSQDGQKNAIINLTNTINSRPMYDKRRVFLIEEVDQLSSASKLALLKIIEKDYSNRSPVHFILLSMESNGVPQSIKSRCQVYNFRPVSVKDTMYAMKSIMERTGDWSNPNIPTTFKTEGLATIASISKGSLRIAVQNLESCIEGEIYNKEDIEGMLGGIDEVSSYKILSGLLEKSRDPEMWKTIYKSDPQELYNYLTLIISNAMIYKVTGYIDDSRFEDSTQGLIKSNNLSKLFDILTKHPQLCKPYMRKSDLMSALAEYYRDTIGNNEKGERLMEAISPSTPQRRVVRR